MKNIELKQKFGPHVFSPINDDGLPAVDSIIQKIHSTDNSKVTQEEKEKAFIICWKDSEIVVAETGLSVSEAFFD